MDGKLRQLWTSHKGKTESTIFTRNTTQQSSVSRMGTHCMKQQHICLFTCSVPEATFASLNPFFCVAVFSHILRPKGERESRIARRHTGTLSRFWLYFTFANLSHKNIRQTSTNHSTCTSTHERYFHVACAKTRKQLFRHNFPCSCVGALPLVLSSLPIVFVLD